MFLPTTMEEVKKIGWEELDIILVSGDTYIDSSYNGSAVIGKWLVKNGFRVGIIAQPDINSDVDIKRLGQPRLYWAISGGCVDSMVANYTATKKKRKQDDFTPGGENNRRPDRAVIAYTNLVKRYFKNSDIPIVISGIEASLRRITHYDYWSNNLRRPVIFDAKADILSYGMGEKSMLALAKALKGGREWRNIKGLCYIAKDKKDSYLQLPSHEECLEDKLKFIEAFNIFYRNCDPITAKGIYQKCGDRYLIQNPPSENFSSQELDDIYSMEFEREVHPYYKKMGDVRALDTIRNSVTTHRGCYGECNFCAIAIHQGRTVISRSEDSIVEEIKKISGAPKFKGYIADVGGPTANMYQVECSKKLKLGACQDRRCLYPQKCPALKIDHSKQVDLLNRLKKIDKIKKIFIASGIRYDMILDDKKCGQLYLEDIIKDHVSGQMKIAPEHTEDKVLSLMGKQGKTLLKDFKERFYKINEKYGLKQFLTYYLIAAHPGCTEKDMLDLKRFASAELRVNPEQVQIFTPTPSTYSTLMYYTEINPFTMKKMYVEKDNGKKQKQKDIVVVQEKSSKLKNGNTNNKNKKNYNRKIGR
ncbi:MULTISPECIES: YgiQ family radical SAM protein [unclassified Fusobacterium]|uniref:YgiQ family radical SAM protein n=1 Tax=unclassified Fusobacterium TaxID=2648384 RepID=UPI0025C21F71|nr:YgiQ family radical SAM protein [Fusobacterium sp.]